MLFTTSIPAALFQLLETSNNRVNAALYHDSNAWTFRLTPNPHFLTQALLVAHDSLKDTSTSSTSNSAKLAESATVSSRPSRSSPPRRAGAEPFIVRLEKSTKALVSESMLPLHFLFFSSLLNLFFYNCLSHTHIIVRLLSCPFQGATIRTEPPSMPGGVSRIVFSRVIEGGSAYDSGVWHAERSYARAFKTHSLRDVKASYTFCTLCVQPPTIFLRRHLPRRRDSGGKRHVGCWSAWPGRHRADGECAFFYCCFVRL